MGRSVGVPLGVPRLLGFPWEILVWVRHSGMLCQQMKHHLFGVSRWDNSLTKLCFEGFLLLFLMCRVQWAPPPGSHVPLVPWFPQPPRGSSPYNMSPFRNGNGHISTPVRRKPLRLSHSKALFEIYNLYPIGIVNAYHI